MGDLWITVTANFDVLEIVKMRLASELDEAFVDDDDLLAVRRHEVAEVHSAVCAGADAERVPSLEPQRRLGIRIVQKARALSDADPLAGLILERAKPAVARARPAGLVAATDAVSTDGLPTRSAVLGAGRATLVASTNRVPAAGALAPGPVAAGSVAPRDGATPVARTSLTGPTVRAFIGVAPGCQRDDQQRNGTEPMQTRSHDPDATSVESGSTRQCSGCHFRRKPGRSRPPVSPGRQVSSNRFLNVSGILRA